VIITSSPGYSGTDPAIIRMRNVSGTSFDIKIQEWDYLNQVHALEQLSFLVIERGHHLLENDTEVEAGWVETANTLASGYVPVAFDQAFSSPPVILTSVMTFNGSQAVTTRIRNVTAFGFEVAMQEEEGNDQVHATERISYVALESGPGHLLGSTFEVSTIAALTHSFDQVSFGETFVEAPCFYANMQTTSGTDPASLRWRHLTASGVQLKVEEETSMDLEIIHAAETIGYLAISCSSPSL
jgi:hypothetical protein